MPRSQPPSDSLRRLQGRVGGLQKWTDRAAAEEQLAGARLAFQQRFTTEQERKLWYARLALKSAQTRARKRRPERQPVEEVQTTD